MRLKVVSRPQYPFIAIFDTLERVSVISHALFRNMDRPMTIRLQACVQSLVFVIMLTATLFGTAGRFDILGFWVYVAIMARGLGFVPHHSIQISCRSGCGRAVAVWAGIFCHWSS